MRCLFFTLGLLFSFQLLTAQKALRWVVEGALHSTAITEGVTYSFSESVINNVAYVPGTHPVLWGAAITTTTAGVSDTFDFEIIVETDGILGTGERQVAVYSADSSMDFQTTFTQTPLSQEFRLQFNIFKYGTRVNAPFAAGTSGTPQNMSIGFAQPNDNVTGIARLHSAELYYIERLSMGDPIGAVVMDVCNQVDTFITGVAYSNLIAGSEDIDGTALNDAKMNNSYPYNISNSRTYVRVMEAQNSCDANGNNRMEVNEASYNVYFTPMSSFIIGRRDLKKISNLNTGVKSAIGFYLSPSYDPSTIPTLPIELAHFSGRQQERSIQLEWSTASEINNHLFEIERSLNGIEWTKLGEVESFGNSSRTQSYQFEDFEYNFANNYYRLKQIDFDGHYTYSKIIVVRPNLTAKQIVFYPNPVQDVLYIDNFTTEETLNVMIYNLMGEKVQQFLNINNSKIQLDQLPKGVYILQVEDGASKMIQKQKIVKH